MNDLKKMVNNLQQYKTKLAYKKFNLDVDYFKELTSSISEIRNACQVLQEERNIGSKKIGVLLKENKNEELEKIKDMMTEHSDKIKNYEVALREKEQELENYMLLMPNIPTNAVPVGAGEEDNVVKGYFGTKPKFDFEPLEHHILGEKMGILDMERGAKLSGSRFAVLYGSMARLDMAVKNFLFDCGIEHGYTPVYVPFMVGRNIATGTGQLPKFEEDMFKTESNGKELFLIPTAEVPVTNLYNNEILKEDDLTIKHISLTPCFRVEAGSAGRDIKGIFRQHQFDKVEMVKFAHPETSYEELESLTADAMHILDKLGLHYRKVALSTGDLGFAAAFCYDVEVWLPGQNAYREISSCSNFEDFQARRANIRFKNNKTGKNEYVHTLNGSGLPVGRLMIAIMENYQQKDGSILIPEALKKYLPYEKIDSNGNLV